MSELGGTRLVIRHGRLLMVAGPRERETIVRAMDLSQAISFASQLLEAIDKLAVLQQVSIVCRREPEPDGCIHLAIEQMELPL